MKMLANIFNSSTGETEVGGFLWMWSQSDLHSVFQDSRGYAWRPYIKGKIRKGKHNQECYSSWSEQTIWTLPIFQEPMCLLLPLKLKGLWHEEAKAFN